mmetsp:Transcript_77815/g.231815  ORF Transcript_77815/g.231815 Transcript_77815/m.231815 type:complete len:222 (+) Transcript_77815:150-815(+)
MCPPAARRLRVASSCWSPRRRARAAAAATRPSPSMWRAVESALIRSGTASAPPPSRAAFAAHPWRSPRRRARSGCAEGSCAATPAAPAAAGAGWASSWRSRVPAPLRWRSQRVPAALSAAPLRAVPEVCPARQRPCTSPAAWSCRRSALGGCRRASRCWFERAEAAASGRPATGAERPSWRTCEMGSSRGRQLCSSMASLRKPWTVYESGGGLRGQEAVRA